jgi:hypothetical protein
MILTNVTGLPQSIVNLASYAWYDDPQDSDITITRLIKPPRIVNLYKRHKHEIKVDVQELAWSILGSAIHVMLERCAGLEGEEVIVEQRMRTVINGWKVSGKPDAYYPGNKKVDDYKVTSVYSFQSDKPEWEAQLNLNAMLHRLKRQEVESINIVAVLRDFSRKKAEVDHKYPQHGVYIQGYPVWSLDDQKKLALERVLLHQEASELPDDELPLCTPEERWYRGGGWAVYKKGNKKADRLLDTYDEAKQYIEDNPPPPAKVSKKTGKELTPAKHYEEPRERKGENIRCLHYCEARQFCSFAQSLVAENEYA